MRKASGGNPAWVRWYASDAFSGTYNLTAVEECAYRRILDLIFMTDDNLRDDDRTMPGATKTGRQWRVVKARLIDLGKIQVVNGFIRNARATETCSETRAFRAQKVAAAVSSHAPGKRMKTLNSDPAGAVSPQVREGLPANSQQQAIGELRSPAAGGAGERASPLEASASLVESEDSLAAEGSVSGPAVATPGQADRDLFGEVPAKRPTSRQVLHGEGVSKLEEMLGRRFGDSDWSWLGKLVKDAQGDHALVLGVVQAAHRRWLDPEQELTAPKSWIRKQVMDRAKPALRELPAEVNGWVVADVIEECQRLLWADLGGCWEGKVPTILVEALEDGADAGRHIYPVMRTAKKWGVDNIKTHGWFRKAIQAEMAGRSAA